MSDPDMTDWNEDERAKWSWADAEVVLARRRLGLAQGQLREALRERSYVAAAAKGRLTKLKHRQGADNGNQER